MEILWTGIGSFMSGDTAMKSFTSLWMLLIYGSAIFLEAIHNRVKGWILPLRTLVWLFLIWGIEYSSGFLMQEFVGMSPWHYVGNYAIGGLIRLDYAPVWIIVGLVFEKIHTTLVENEIIFQKKV